MISPPVTNSPNNDDIVGCVPTRLSKHIGYGDVKKQTGHIVARRLLYAYHYTHVNIYTPLLLPCRRHLWAPSLQRYQKNLQFAPYHKRNLHTFWGISGFFFFFSFHFAAQGGSHCFHLSLPFLSNLQSSIIPAAGAQMCIQKHLNYISFCFQFACV